MRSTSRKKILFGSVIVVVLVMVGAALTLYVKNKRLSTPPPIEKLDIYLPTWSAGYSSLELPSTINRAYVSFAVPDGSIIKQPDRSPNFTQMASTAKNLSWAIGGWGPDEKQHLDILNSWDVAASDPAAFASRVENLLASWPKTNGVDIDWEYPEDGAKFTSLIKAIRVVLPKTHISVAVSASPYSHAYPLEAFNYVDTVNVMTYDYVVPSGASVVGDATSGHQILASVDEWEGYLSGLSKKPNINVGLPSNVYIYKGARKLGDSFSGTIKLVNGHSPTWSDMTKAVDDPAKLRTDCWDKNGNWAACFSPTMARLTISRLRQKYPDIGVFVWEGSDEGYIEGLTSN
jgi:hypothetical protein